MGPDHVEGDEVRGDVETDRDELAEDRDRAADLRDRDANERDILALEHERLARDRDRPASEQHQIWSDHDQAASRQDQRSSDVDQRTADEEGLSGHDADAHDKGVLAREQSARDRDAASAARDGTTAARLEEDDAARASREAALLLAEHDRTGAADDRAAAAVDRDASARERVGALRSRTEAAAAAQRAAETLESMSDAFFTLDFDWRFTYVNPQCEIFFGRRREDIVGKIVWDALPETVGTRFDEEYRRAVREQVPVRFEEAYEALDRIVEVRAYPVIAGLAVYFCDVTNERLRDARLRQTERLETLGQLTAGVAHDFNNFLAAIVGYASLGKAASLDEKTTKYFDAIDSAGQQAVALTRQLLVFARKQDLAPMVIDLNEVVDGISSLLGNLLPSGVELHLELSPQPVAVFVDRSQLEQVVINLVVNSRDAIDTTGSITIRTSVGIPASVVHRVDAGSGWLQVSDTGSGIPDDVRPHIFDPFFTTKTPETGTGLGLATIYGIVSQSDGAIFVDSAVGVGTTVSVALPGAADPVVGKQA